MLIQFKTYKAFQTIILVIVFYALSICTCIAQLTSTIFETFSNTQFNSYLVNPSATDSSYNFKANFNNINELGLLKNVRKFYFDGDKRLFSNKENEYHHIGLQTFNNKFGDYINTSRLHLRYSWFSPISKEAFLSAGASIGFVNYTFQTSLGSTGGSDYGPDGSIGMHYLRKGIKIGIAIQQLFTLTLIPVQQSFTLSKLYNIDVAKEITLSPKVDLAIFSVYQIAETGSYSYNFGCVSTIANIGIFGINNFNLYKTSISTGLKNIKFLDTTFQLISSYSFYTSGISPSDNTLELFLAIQK